MTVVERQYFFLSGFYMYGECVTFDSHLLRLLGKKRLFHIINEFGERIKDGGLCVYITATTDLFVIL